MFRSHPGPRPAFCERSARSLSYSITTTHQTTDALGTPTLLRPSDEGRGRKNDDDNLYGSCRSGGANVGAPEGAPEGARGARPERGVLDRADRSRDRGAPGRG